MICGGRGWRVNENMSDDTLLTGYPSIDKPWLKYYSQEAIEAKLPECSLYEYLYENNKDYKDEYALNYFGRKITYGELFEQIDLTARAFLAQGVKPGDICTIVTLSCVTSVLCFYALNKIGAVSNFVKVLTSEEELAKYFEEAESEVIITLDLFGEKVIKAAHNGKCRKIISYSLTEWMPLKIKIGFQIKMKGFGKWYLQDKRIIKWKEFLNSGQSIMKECTFSKNPRKLCLLAHTGGTTGFSKSVLISDFSANAIAYQYYLCMELKRKSIYLNILPPFFVYGLVVCLHMPLSLGLCTTIIPKFDIKEWKEYLTKYKPNYILGVPPYFAAILKENKMTDMDLSFVKAWGVGGDGMNEILEKNINAYLLEHKSNAKILKGYGMTEVCGTAVVEQINCYKTGSVGVPLVKNNIQIYDNEKKMELKYGEIGEICLQCPSLMLGYKNNENEMKRLIVKHLDGGYWVHTGDLGYIDKDGFLFINGRMKRFIMVIKDGAPCKVYSAQIEKIIQQIDCVENVCVVGTKYKDMKVPKAFIVVKKGHLIEHIKEKARVMCQEKLPDYMCPYFYEFIDELPLTVAGKVDYKALEELSETKRVT